MVCGVRRDGRGCDGEQDRTESRVMEGAEANEIGPEAGSQKVGSEGKLVEAGSETASIGVKKCSLGMDGCPGRE